MTSIGRRQKELDDYIKKTFVKWTRWLFYKTSRNVLYEDCEEIVQDFWLNNYYRMDMDKSVSQRVAFIKKGLFWQGINKRIQNSRIIKNCVPFETFFDVLLYEADKKWDADMDAKAEISEIVCLLKKKGRPNDLIALFIVYYAFQTGAKKNAVWKKFGIKVSTGEFWVFRMKNRVRRMYANRG